ncbi:hypothetical protein HMPREF1868_00516 [Olsenella sp. DNF00959]|nr:hypothetical protein HMPREF1868_00516 [Olsenella sp. DNF00959]
MFFLPGVPWGHIMSKMPIRQRGSGKLPSCGQPGPSAPPSPEEDHV